MASPAPPPLEIKVIIQTKRGRLLTETVPVARTVGETVKRARIALRNRDPDVELSSSSSDESESESESEGESGGE